jgi:hypothetical protein
MQHNKRNFLLDNLAFAAVFPTKGSEKHRYRFCEKSQNAYIKIFKIPNTPQNIAGI